jgi:hypothetical protein
MSPYMRRLMTIALLTAALVAPSSGYAQDDPRKVQAAPFFEEARKLAEKGKDAESLESFRKAYAIYPSPNTLYNIARQEHVLGQRLAALRDYREALRNPVLLPQVAEMARGYVAELERSVGRVKIVGPEGARVKVADREVTLPVSEPVDVEPGAVVVRGTHGSEQLSATADVKAGTLITVDLNPSAAPSTTGAVEPPQTPPDTSASSTKYVVTGTLAALAIASGAFGIVYTAKTNGKISDAKEFDTNTPGGACQFSPSASCAQYRSMLDDAHSSRTVATIGWAGLAVFAIAGGITWFIWPSSGNKASLRPAFIGTGAGLAGEF